MVLDLFTELIPLQPVGVTSLNKMIWGSIAFLAVSLLCEAVRASDPTDEKINAEGCGVNNIKERIVNGSKVPEGGYPWMVHLTLVAEDGFQECGGSLITKWHVLTAAHCVVGVTGIGVSYGHVNYLEANTTTAIKYYIHEKFVFPGGGYDVALLLLEQEIPFNEKLCPICLPEGDLDVTGRSGVVAGWGSLEFNGSSTNELMSTRLVIQPQDKCRELLEPPAYYNSDSMICAYENYTDSCEGDSGGPLMVDFSGKWTEVGIVSFGFDCAQPDTPGVYTNVPNFVSWIKDGISHIERFTDFPIVEK